MFERSTLEKLCFRPCMKKSLPKWPAAVLSVSHFTPWLLTQQWLHCSLCGILGCILGLILTELLLAKVSFDLQGKDKGEGGATKTLVILDTCDPFCASK